MGPGPAEGPRAQLVPYFPEGASPRRGRAVHAPASVRKTTTVVRGEAVGDAQTRMLHQPRAGLGRSQGRRTDGTRLHSPALNGFPFELACRSHGSSGWESHESVPEMNVTRAAGRAAGVPSGFGQPDQHFDPGEGGREACRPSRQDLPDVESGSAEARAPARSADGGTTRVSVVCWVGPEGPARWAPPRAWQQSRNWVVCACPP